MQNVRKIVESHKEGALVVVSALGGVTDLLLKTSSIAASGDPGYEACLREIGKRHHDMVAALFPSGNDALDGKLDPMLEELAALCKGVFLLGVLPEKTKHRIVSFGERLSSLIVSSLIGGAELHDSLKFIKTVPSGTGNVLDQDLTDKLVKDEFEGFPGSGRIAIIPGFISTDAFTGEITNLGRGGSDYTASIVAAALDAECLEIWTDVDGFMTADPRIIKTSYVIDELSFAEAMELCHFGAKVVYAPALYPVCPKDIPVLIKNTFNPEARGTVIRQKISGSRRAVTGIASIDEMALLTLSGPSMVGIVGIVGRLFGALSARDVSVFLISQSSSETGISIGVASNKAGTATEAINAEFAAEITRGAMHPATAELDLAAVAVVGEGMKHSSGIAGKLFSTLGRNGIGVLACAQGSSDYNISMVVKRTNLRKVLNVIHDSFFLSEYQELNLFICGVGTVGGSLLEQIAMQREKLMRENSLKLNIVGIARSTRAVFDRDGIDPANWQVRLAEGKPVTKETLRDEVIGMNIFNSVFVDCTASADIASLYGDFFENGISVVAANKVAAASSWENYEHLKTLARRRNVKYLFETNVGAGLPIINTINALCNSGDKVEKIEAVLSGTLNFIFNTISADIPFSETVRMAKEQGYSEPDPRIDLSGRDVMRKLVILSREAGHKVELSDVEAGLFIPEEFFNCTMDEFWAKLPSLDAGFEERRKKLEAEGKQWKFVAKMADGKYTASLQEVGREHPFYGLEGSNNIILLTTERYHRHPMMIQGYGAGASVTAAGVFADIMSIANIR